MIFVNSMSDMFHEGVPDRFLQETFRIMKDCPQHQFQILTKRSSRMKEIDPQLVWPPNIWMGVSVENQDYAFRIDDLRQVPSKIRFVSFEPLLGPLHNPNLEGIDWVIVGGESGPHARPMDPDWVREIRDLCLEQKIRFFFKQWGGVNKKKAGRLLDGGEYNEMPNY